MANIAVPNTAVANTLIKSADYNANLSEIQSKFNTYAVQTDVAKTITVSHTFSANQNMTGGVTGNVTGNASTATKLATPTTINGVSFDGSAPVTVPAAAGTLTGAALAAGVTASSLTSVGVLAAPHMTSPVIDSGGLSVTAGTSNLQALNAGNTVISGTLAVTGAISGIGLVSAVALTADATNTTTTPQATGLTVSLGASQTWKIDFDLAISCDNTGGVGLSFSAPSGATGRTSLMGADTSATAFLSQSSATFGQTAWSHFNSSANPVYVRACCYVTTSATPGSFTLQFVAVVGTQTAKILTGSTMIAARIS